MAQSHPKTNNPGPSTNAGIQWDGPSIFKDNAPAHNDARHDSIAPNDSPRHQGNVQEDLARSSVLDVPMLPGVSLEPIYRQHRSLSFSMGQEPAFFGYDDYDQEESSETASSAFKSNLETMVEEEEVEDSESRFRTRSKSSGAAFGFLSLSQQRQLLGQLGKDIPQPILEEEPAEDTAPKSDPPHPTHMPMSRSESEPYNPIAHLTQQLESMQLLQANATVPYPTPVTVPYHPHQHHLHHHHPPPPHLPDMYASHPHNPASSVAPPAVMPPLPPPGYGPMPFMHPHQQPPLMTPEEKSTTSDSRDMGKGVMLHRLPSNATLYLVEFKAGRTDFFYIQDASLQPRAGDLVIVEADRGKDLGKVARVGLTVDEVTQLHAEKQPSSPVDAEEDSGKTELHIKRIFRLAAPDEISHFLLKSQEEQRALALCQQKTRQRKLPMEVVDAEYQWDRRKLTFYFVADRRIDFRELVRELFKIYKTRIWMCAVNANA